MDVAAVYTNYNTCGTEYLHRKYTGQITKITSLKF